MPIAGVIARLRDGVEKSQAEAELRTIAAQLAAADPVKNKNLPVELLKDFSIVPEFRRDLTNLLFVLTSLAAMVLLIAIANLVNLLLMRATARRAEIATRLSLGATQWDLIRHLVIESLTLSAAGAVAAIAIASWLGSYLLTLSGVGAGLRDACEPHGLAAGVSGSADRTGCCADQSDARTAWRVRTADPDDIECQPVGPGLFLRPADWCADRSAQRVWTVKVAAELKMFEVGTLVLGCNFGGRSDGGTGFTGGRKTARVTGVVKDLVHADPFAGAGPWIYIPLARAAAFGTIAMLGVYGVIAYSVSQRRHEYGVRLALGATPGNIRRLVLRQAAVFAAMESLHLYGVPTNDPVSFATAAFIIAVARFG